ncbi:unnamed protein product [Pleuronectes platessa]|uniref:Uncharacterized protein n=1 Tax=Pleuronectes platessa TaxID=8262 RepID=A0A9N7W3A6_PLEPL|nr:unnamed protein product [Pleuronectes platessa]
MVVNRHWDMVVNRHWDRVVNRQVNRAIRNHSTPQRYRKKDLCLHGDELKIKSVLTEGQQRRSYAGELVPQVEELKCLWVWDGGARDGQAAWCSSNAGLVLDRCALGSDQENEIAKTSCRNEFSTSGSLAQTSGGSSE